MRHRKLGTIYLVLGLALALSGCPKDPYRASIQGSADVSQAVSAAIRITSQYYGAGTIDDAEKAKAAVYLSLVTDCNMSFRKAVVTVHVSGQTGAPAYLAVANSFLSCTQSAIPVLKNSKVQTYIQAVETAINGISLAVASAKGAS